LGAAGMATRVGDGLHFGRVGRRGCGLAPGRDTHILIDSSSNVVLRATETDPGWRDRKCVAVRSGHRPDYPWP
jgi:hypothetical protein